MRRVASVFILALASCGGSGNGGALDNRPDAGLEAEVVAGDVHGISDGVAETKPDLAIQEHGAPDDAGAPDDGAGSDLLDAEGQEPSEVLEGDHGSTPEVVGPDTDGGPQCNGPGAACPDGGACVPDTAKEGWVCAHGGTVQKRGECTGDPKSCVAGTVCVPFDDKRSFCRPLCTFDGKLPCAEKEVCVGNDFPNENVGVCLGDPCTPPAQDCPEGGRCTVILGSYFACTPAGPVPVGGDCKEEECQAGAICKVSPSGDYTCRKLCQTAKDCSPPEHCIYPFQGIKDWGWCDESECDPVTQTGCKVGEGCYYQDPEKGTTLCWTAGKLPVGAVCDVTQFCVPGADCFADPGSAGPDFTYHCYAYCDDSHPCASGTCQYTDMMKGVGLCLL